jgi:diadenosine tetraphosphatase ApaH/serine/threonine PP2A family protein phosphatase
MKPFDLEAAKAGAKLVTRDGRAVISFKDASNGSEYPCEAIIDDIKFIAYFSERGEFYHGHPHDLDLFIAPDTRTMYMNLFPDGVAYWFDTEAEARAGLNARALKIAVPVTYEV